MQRCRCTSFLRANTNEKATYGTVLGSRSMIGTSSVAAAFGLRERPFLEGLTREARSALFAKCNLKYKPVAA